jgi:hypothetical protein
VSSAEEGAAGAAALAISCDGRRGREDGVGPGRRRAGLQIGRGLNGAREEDLPGVGSGRLRQEPAGRPVRGLVSNRATRVRLGWFVIKIR